jgi:hypothetical protein
MTTELKPSYHVALFRAMVQESDNETVLKLLEEFKRGDFEVRG